MNELNKKILKKQYFNFFDGTIAQNENKLRHLKNANTKEEFLYNSIAKECKNTSYAEIILKYWNNEKIINIIDYLKMVTNNKIFEA